MLPQFKLPAPSRPAVYLDANATERLRPQAREAVLAALDLAGNPSSVHSAGRAARKLLEECRVSIASRFGAAPADVIFTSGGTEANALAIHSLCVQGGAPGRQVILGATEHDAVRAAAPGARILPVDASGHANLDILATWLAEGPSLLCLMLANNETGVLHPVADAAALCRRHGALLHVDAVQAAGRLEFSVESLGATSIAISGHKVGGPKGAGALITRPDLPIAAQLAGGGQERGRRGGTPALPAIAGFAAALAASSPTDAAALAPLRDQAEAAAIAAGAIVCGGGARLPNTTCLARPGLRADLAVIALDLAGIAVSAGAACSSGKVTRSHVLDAMGLPHLAAHAIRVSLPWDTTPADIQRFAAAYAALPSAAPASPRHQKVPA
jgi:cysteine desulfurase